MSGAVSASSMVMMAGVGMQAYGAYSSSKQAKAGYQAQAQIAANNAQLAEWQAEDAEQRGQVKANAQGMHTRQLKGAQRAGMAANGVDLGVGSAQQVLTDTDYFGQIDRDTILANSAREAWGYRMQGKGYTADSSLLSARASAQSPGLAAATTLMGGAGKVAAGWYGAGSTGSAGGGLGVPGFSAMGTYG